MASEEFDIFHYLKIQKMLFANLRRLSIIDQITNHDFIGSKDWKVLGYSNPTMCTRDHKPYKIDVVNFGLGKDGFVPFTDCLLELAFDPLQPAVNVVVADKGDNPKEVRCDSNLLGVTERPDQAEIRPSDRPMKLLKKWGSFYIKNPILP